MFIIPILIIRNSEFIVNNKRLIAVTSLIYNNIIEMNLQKVETINVEQGFVAGIMNYCTTRLFGSYGTIEFFKNIKNPMDFSENFHMASAN